MSKVNFAKLQELKRKGILTEEYYNSGGPGGQHNNKTLNACKAACTWNIDGIPTTFRANASSDKSLQKNRMVAFRHVVSKLMEHIENLKPRGRQQTAGFASGERVRNYHEPDNRVTNPGGDLSFPFRDVIEKTKPAALNALFDERRQIAASKGDRT